MLIAAFDARIAAVNPAWSATLGWSEAELIGTSFMDLVHPDDADATRQAAERLAGGQPTLLIREPVRHRDGRYRWLSWTAVPEAGPIHGIARDITAEKEAAAGAAPAPRSSCGRRRRWKPSASSPAASRTTSTTC